MATLIDVQPREVVGRDIIARFRGQFAAAAFASLRILDGKDVDRVYCDFHDDFVVRQITPSGYVYHFHQVKTKAKRNHLWKISETSGINIKAIKSPTIEDFEKVRESFFGRLLVHTINFGSSCKEVTFVTNVQFEDEVLNLLNSLTDGTKNKYSAFLVTQFDNIFNCASPSTSSEVISHLRKLSILPSVMYVAPDGGDFETQAQQAIYKFSEIDLTYSEAREIANDLLNLAHTKSYRRIGKYVTTSELDENAGIGIDDLLSVLSISKTAYSTLLNGGDEKALKHASIIQRRLQQARATPEMIEYCTRQKVGWDIWVREARHTIRELDFNALQSDLSALVRRWNGEEWRWLMSEIRSLSNKLANEGFPRTVDEDLLMGGFFATLVRSGVL
jgi:hypothetical protein